MHELFSWCLNFLRKSGHQAVILDGETDARDRHAMVVKFRDNPACRVAVVSITAGGVGLEFTAADVVVFAELVDTSHWLLQARPPPGGIECTPHHTRPDMDGFAKLAC